MAHVCRKTVDVLLKPEYGTGRARTEDSLQFTDAHTQLGPQNPGQPAAHGGSSPPAQDRLPAPTQPPVQAELMEKGVERSRDGCWGASIPGRGTG